MKELRSEIEIKRRPNGCGSSSPTFPVSPNGTRSSAKRRGNIRVGERLEVNIQPSGASAMTFRPTVLKVEPNRELRWLGHLLISGLFDGEHIFTIEPLGEGRVRFTQREVFTGLLVPLFARGLDTDTRRGFEEMNQALKARAEQVA